MIGCPACLPAWRPRRRRKTQNLHFEMNNGRFVFFTNKKKRCVSATMNESVCGLLTALRQVMSRRVTSFACPVDAFLVSLLKIQKENVANSFQFLQLYSVVLSLSELKEFRRRMTCACNRSTSQDSNTRYHCYDTVSCMGSTRIRCRCWSILSVTLSLCTVPASVQNT